MLPRFGFESGQKHDIYIGKSRIKKTIRIVSVIDEGIPPSAIIVFVYYRKWKNKMQYCIEYAHKLATEVERGA